MAGTVVEYARFVKAQERRACVVSQRLQPPPDTSQETNKSAAVDDHAFDVDKSRQQFRAMQDQAAQHRGSTRVSLDVG